MQMLQANLERLREQQWRASWSYWLWEGEGWVFSILGMIALMFLVSERLFAAVSVIAFAGVLGLWWALKSSKQTLAEQQPIPEAQEGSNPADGITKKTEVSENQPAMAVAVAFGILILGIAGVVFFRPLIIPSRSSESTKSTVPILVAKKTT